MPATKKFTARNVAALTALANECGLSFSLAFGRRNIDFSTRAPVDGDFSPVSEEEDVKMADFADRANTMFGDREHFFACNRYRFVRCDWSKDTRTQSQIDNVD